MRLIPARRGRAGAVALLPLTAVAVAASIAYASPTISPNTGSTPLARLAAPDTVPFGKRIALAGRVTGWPGAAVGLEFRPDGGVSPHQRGAGWRPLRRVRADRAGRYRASVRAIRSGAFRAVPEIGGASTPERVRVRAIGALRVAKHHVVLGDRVRIDGRARPRGRRKVKLLVRGTRRDVLGAASGRGGSFHLRWRPRRPGTYRLRAAIGANRLAAGGRSGARRVTVYRRALASWYGPGLYGNPLACGGTLTTETMGVAHRTLPCGTRLTLRYGKRTARVRVVDRGPFVGGRELDLAGAVRAKLGFPDLGYVLSSR